MVKIISTIPAPEVTKQVLCRNCGATLEYTPNDVRKKTETDYTGCIDSYKMLTCPNCKHDITLRRCWC